MQFAVIEYPSDESKAVVLERVQALEPEFACDRFIQFLQGHGIDPGTAELELCAAFVVDTLGRVFCCGYFDDDENLRAIRAVTRPWALVMAWLGRGWGIKVDSHFVKVQPIFPGTVKFLDRAIVCTFPEEADLAPIRLGAKDLNGEHLLFNSWRMIMGGEKEDWVFETEGFVTFAEVDEDDWHVVETLLPPELDTTGIRQVCLRTGDVAVNGKVVGQVDVLELTTQMELHYATSKK